MFVYLIIMIFYLSLNMPTFTRTFTRPGLCGDRIKIRLIKPPQAANAHSPASLVLATPHKQGSPAEIYAFAHTFAPFVWRCQYQAGGRMRIHPLRQPDRAPLGPVGAWSVLPPGAATATAGTRAPDMAEKMAAPDRCRTFESSNALESNSEGTWGTSRDASLQR